MLLKQQQENQLCLMAFIVAVVVVVRVLPPGVVRAPVSSSYRPI